MRPLSFIQAPLAFTQLDLYDHAVLTSNSLTPYDDDLYNLPSEMSNMSVRKSGVSTKQQDEADSR